MKKLNSILITGLLTILAGGCNPLGPVNYANREWHISSHYGQIIDSDTTYRMTFGNVLAAVDQPIISCADSAAKYPGMDRFIADILHTAGLENDEVLFYSPEHRKMFVRLTNERKALRPSSLSVDLPKLTYDNENERPYTLWIYEDDAEDWHRKPEEMYTYTYFDRKKQRILIVDFYDYGEIPVAQIYIHQSRNKMTDRMGLPEYLWSYYKHNLRDYERDIEFWSHQIDGHRQNAFDNYRIGQEQIRKQK